MNLQKCQFLKDETRYLGFIINKNGVKPDIGKVEVIQLITNPYCSQYGHLSPSIVIPEHLKESLLNIQTKLPRVEAAS